MLRGVIHTSKPCLSCYFFLYNRYILYGCARPSHPTPLFPVSSQVKKNMYELEWVSPARGEKRSEESVLIFEHHLWSNNNVVVSAQKALLTNLAAARFYGRNVLWDTTRGKIPLFSISLSAKKKICRGKNEYRKNTTTTTHISPGTGRKSTCTHYLPFSTRKIVPASHLLHRMNFKSKGPRWPWVQEKITSFPFGYLHPLCSIVFSGKEIAHRKKNSNRH